MNIPQLVSGSDDGAVKIWDLGSFLDEFGDGSATSEEQKEIVRSVVSFHLFVSSKPLGSYCVSAILETSIETCRRASLNHRGHHSPASLRGHNVHSLITADHTLRDLSNQVSEQSNKLVSMWLANQLLMAHEFCIHNPILSPNLFQSFIFHDLHHEMVLCVAFSHDGEEVVAGGMSGHVKVGPVTYRGCKK